MRKIDLIVIHCSATREDRCFTEFDLDVCHRRRGFNGPGYHFYIRKDGRIVSTRPVEKIGARRVSVSVMKAGWTRGAVPRIPGRSGRYIRCGCW